MFWKRKPEPRELSYGSPWAERDAKMKEALKGASFGPGAEVILPSGQAYDVEKEGLYEPAVGTDRVYAVEIIDGSGSQIVYTDDNPIISVREI